MNRIKTIGKGGLGIVSLYQTNEGQVLAIKQMLHQWDTNYYERFKREISIMTDLIHKNIIKILSYDISNSNPWYSMPYYKDGTLRDKMNSFHKKNEFLNNKAATGIIYHLAVALEFAHNKGIVHRDLKPENILFDGKEPVLADWGIGKFIHKESKVLTKGGIGTYQYCAPEQWQEGEADCRSDIYSLGLIYRELLTGSTTGEIQDTRLNYIVNKMTMASPTERYSSMSEVKLAIENLNEISTVNPLNEFWKGAAIIGGTAALIYLLAELLSE